MNNSFKTFPNGQGKDAVEFSIEVHDWKEAFVSELRERLAIIDFKVELNERLATEKRVIKEVLGE